MQQCRASQGLVLSELELLSCLPSSLVARTFICQLLHGETTFLWLSMLVWESSSTDTTTLKPVALISTELCKISL